MRSREVIRESVAHARVRWGEVARESIARAGVRWGEVARDIAANVYGIWRRVHTVTLCSSRGIRLDTTKDALRHSAAPMD